MTVPRKGYRQTKTQLAYLRMIEERGSLRKGWGGYSSILTLRILEDRGLIRLIEHGSGVWTASLTVAGREALL